jgi:DNA-binding HxlR family transcriptional regulator
MPKRHVDYDGEGCPAEAALELIRGKWKGAVLYHLMAGEPVRFNALRRFLPTVSQRILTKSLREMEADGLISRTVHAEVPPRVDYALTDRGRALVPAIQALAGFGQDWVLEGRRAA